MSDPIRNDETAVGTVPWDPFQLMDRLDEEAFRRELEGVASTDLVYVVKEGGQEIVGLSKTGVDACCMALVSQGQVIREEDLAYDLVGEGENREALFRVKAARYAVNPAGGELRLDQVIGVKRQPLFYEPAQLDLDAKAPSKKYRGRTYRELLGFAEGREYLGWMAEHFSESSIRDFVKRILAGEEIVAVRGKQLNPHWYEAGAMKAARNARFRLIPGNVRAQVIAQARESGQTKVVDARSGAPISDVTKPRTPAASEAAPAGERQQQAPRSEPERQPAPAGPYAPTEKQVAFFHRLADSPVFTEEERKAAYAWLAGKATRQSIKDQIDWLKRQVETRRSRPGESSAA